MDKRTPEEVCLWIAGIAKRACQANDMPEVFNCIEWNFSTTLGNRAGRATYNQITKKGMIELSLRLWHLATEDERMDLVIHETCHVITLVKDRYASAHGTNWKDYMGVAGSQAKIFHSIGRKERRIYQLNCCPEGRIGPIQYLKLLVGKQAYMCAFCGTHIWSPKQATVQ